MKSVFGRNMHEALPKCMGMLRFDGRRKGLRAGLGPISIEADRPAERLSYGAPYGLCPFTAMFTALWTLGGRSDVQFLKKFGGYRPGISDDGSVIPWAYGMRMRENFMLASDPETGLSLGTIDQLQSVVLMLSKNPDTCAPVISLWDAGLDLGLQSPNTPEATHIYLNIGNDKRLDMLVSYRNADMLRISMDSIVFSMVQEYIATATSIPLGRMTFMVNYLDVEAQFLKESFGLPADNPYKAEVAAWPLISTNPETWMAELAMFLDEGPVIGMRESFFRHVASPMWQAWAVYKDTSGSPIAQDGVRKALNMVSHIRARDWRAATTEWLQRKIDGET